MRTKSGLVGGLALLVWSAGTASGCGLFHRAPAPPAIVVVEPPIVLQGPPVNASPMPLPPTMAPSDGSGAPPVKTAPPRVGAPPPAARRPARAPAHAAEPAPATDPHAGEHEDQNAAPQLTASLSPQQQASYRRTTLDILGRVEPELSQLSRQRMSADAAATRSQASEYTAQARQALGQGDLVRAQTLAQKAEALTRFLLGQRPI